MKKMKLSQYFKVVNPTYIYLELIPDTSIRNYNSTNIAKSISYMYKKITKRIYREEKKFVYQTQVKCSYMIDIRKDNVFFYFIIPKQYKFIIKEKIQETWKRVTIKEIKEIKPFTLKCLKYQLNYKKEDALSLNVDKKSNEPLNSILNVIDIMKDKDRIGIFYNFIPVTQLGWHKEYNTTIQKIKDYEPVDKEKFNFKYTIKITTSYILKFLEMIIEVLNDFTDTQIKKENKDLSLLEIASELLDNNNKISTMTKKKKDLPILEIQFLVLSDSIDETRKSNNALAVCQSYKSIEENNELIYKKIKDKNKINFTDYEIKNVDVNKVCTEECQNFLQLPGRELLEQYKEISKTDVLESPVPKELQKGTMCLGTSEYKGNKQKAYLSTDKDLKYLTLCIIAPTRSGKSTLISNLAKDSINIGECSIIFDFCGNCELSDEVSSIFTKEKILTIDCTDFENLQGLGYNEVQTFNTNHYKSYVNAKIQSNQLSNLVDSINIDDKALPPKMDRYLSAGALIVFSQNGNINDVFNLLKNYEIRKKFIDNIPKNQFENLKEYIDDLKELNEKDKNGNVIGTRTSSISGILDRVNVLKKNPYMELMLKHSCKNNINLVNEIQKNQLICIKMPDSMFTTKKQKDIYCTYWISKIWLALKLRYENIRDRNKHIKVNIFIDELKQVKHTQEYIKEMLSEMAKFSAKTIISCHYLKQIPIIREELKSAYSSYIFIQGCDKENFKEVKEELKPYELEDMLNLKRYNALNLIAYEKGWAKFITKLPSPLKHN